MSTDQAEKMPWVFEIPDSNFSRLEDRLTKMVRRSRKCKLTPPSFAVIHEADWTKYKPAKDNPGNERPWPQVPYIVHYYYVTVEGERPHIGDWEFVATVEHADEVGNLIKSVPGVGQIPVKYRKAQAICEHCNTARRRLETFVLRNRTTQSYKQVGRNCLVDFFPGESPAEVAQLLQWWTESIEILSGDFDEEGYGGGSSYSRFPMETVLKLTQAVIDCCGWLSRTKAKEQEGGSRATADLVSELLQPPNRQGELTKMLRARLVFKDEYDEMVAHALEWVRELNPEETEDYLYNLFVVCKGESVRLDRLGLACSLMPAHRRFLEGEREKLERLAKPASQHVGSVGDRQVFHALTIKYISEPMHGYNEFSSSQRVIFEDESGNVFMNWCSTEPLGDVGETFDVVGTIKAHTTYTASRGFMKGVPVAQSVINRIKIWDGKPVKPKKKK
jgi:hypothetical protein